MKPLKNKKGTTLLELLLSLMLFSLLILVLYKTVDTVKITFKKLNDEERQAKSIYLLHRQLSNLHNHISLSLVASGPDRVLFFHGTKNEVSFISEHPLLSQYRVPHLIQIGYNQGQLLYRERLFLNFDYQAQEVDGDHFSPDTIFSNLSDFGLKYLVRYRANKKEEWCFDVDTFKGDSMPVKVGYKFMFNGSEYELVFPIPTNYKYEEKSL